VTDRRLGRSFYERDSPVVAPDLLNKVLVAGECAGRVVEVEAYRSDDPASHTYRGRTPRNATMWGPGGGLYVYFTYGMHFCANVVTSTDGDGQAVLLRAAIPLRGLDVMRARRGGRPDGVLADGPAKLCEAFGLDRRHDGTDLTADPDITIVDDGTPPPTDPMVTARIGIRVATDVPWRWIVREAIPLDVSGAAPMRRRRRTPRR
jgi:DNA-3-methyladenine glycosylase